MEDRELLELAARAMGYEIEHFRGAAEKLSVVPPGIINFVYWNPLADDADAFRLAVKLGLSLEIGEPGFGDVQAGKRDNWACEWLNGDNPCAATRRAIVRAAAEIGKKIDAPQNAGD